MASSRPFRRPMMHIDRRDLYTNLETRIQYLHSFLDFSSNDIEALISGSRYIRALIPAIVNIVYKKLLQYDITARAFETRSTSYEGPIDQYPDENSPQILHRKMFLRGYLNKLCSDPSTMEFWEYLDKVGMMHVGRGRQHPLHVEYVHIGVALSFIQDVLNEALLSHPRLKLDKKIALVKALGKVIWIQNDLFAKWYVRDGEEYFREEDLPDIEEEGYLHGKKIIQDNSDPESSPHPRHHDESFSGMSSCPFSGLSSGVAGLAVSEPQEEVTTATYPARSPESPRAAGAGGDRPQNGNTASPTAAHIRVASSTNNSGIPRPVSSSVNGNGAEVGDS